jgi:dTDP-4-dehydrorhamnose reductase
MPPNRPRIYIAGCGGMLGHAVYREFAPDSNIKATDIEVTGDWLQHTDVRDTAAFDASVRDFKPDLLINLAALTDLEFCERNADDAWLTNALGAENAALIAADLDIPVVHISSAGIMSGEQTVYHDFETPAPLGIYAQSKYYAERIVQKLAPKHFVLRAGWMMGGGPSVDKKFINKLFKQILSGATELRVVDDKFGTPTYTVPFAHGIRLVSGTHWYGLYNQVCEGECSRYEVATEFVRLLGLEDRIRVLAVSSDSLAEAYFAPRPRSESLCNLKLRARGFTHMPHWRDALAQYAREFKSALELR